ncbi:ABC transporter substrate-binding protein [Acholeplasma hippikon]|uniref:ABC-type oligopeptide transport system, periplasmic component n=1 Tax=Acholeplasma hippikon TaxID=264636 RepID=A0A449BL16_9MOLU|nr:ABC transporter substrate-binding protein [Acholeplasma hippikon]VEU83166.1 ABC-type oligopeptide transport system, periplasmic component [Acholeplasma hippikon]
MKKVLYGFLLLSLTLLVACTKTNNAPVISGANDTSIVVGTAFDPKAGVTASDKEDGNLTDKIVVTGTVDVNTVATYTLTYSVTDSGDKTTEKIRKVTVTEPNLDGTKYNGVLNLKFADADTKHTFFAAAEKYLLDYMAGGIPYYVANSFSLLADRVTLPVTDYIPSYGWGTRLAEITKDDSQVLGVDGTYGQAGKYTYRDWNNQDFSTLNYWIYDDSVSATYLDFIEGTFFRATLNDARNGWEFVPALAAKAPEAPAASQEIVNGKVTSKVWRVTLRQDLEWAFNSNINTTGFDLKIDANDFYWTYREALTRNFFRAISGGGDFVSEIQGAEGYSKLASEIYGAGGTPTADQLAALDAEWAKVGIKKIDDYTLEFTTKNAKALFDVYYLMGWPAMNEDLYKKHGNQYGTNELTVASSGEYIMNSHESGKVTRYIKNEKYPHASETQWTGWDIYIYNSSEVAFQAFLDGKLESAAIPNARLSEFISDPRLLQTPDATTWRLNVNGLKTVEAQQAQFPGSTYVPEPILGYVEMRKAMYFILDRQALQEDWVPASGLGHTYFSSAYYVDPESGIPYRSTPQGQAVADEYQFESWGFNAGLAQAYFNAAVEKAIAEGFYTAGTAANPTVINLEVRFMQLSTSQATQLRADFVKQEFEKLYDSTNHVKIAVEILDTPFPGIYYDYMMVGEFDVAIDGISGSALDASSFLDVFSSDNRGGFTINWGVDTSLPVIPVEWDHDGNPNTPKITQLFSFDAIATALNGKATIVDGDDVPPVLVPGDYATWTDVKNHLEDFVDVTVLPTFAGEGFQILEDESALGGIWVVLPANYTFAEVKALFEDLGYTYFSAEDYEGEWGAEFAKGSTYVIYGPDWAEGGDSADWAAEYGLVAPTDAEGNLLPSILLY